MSFARGLVCLILIALITILLLIVFRAESDQPELQARLNAYQTFHVFKDTHIHGNELKLTYLEPGKDSLQECQKLCLDQSDCMAVNFYPVAATPASAPTPLAQCWLFTKIERDKIDTQTPCCVLAINNLRFRDVSMVEDVMHMRQAGTKP